MVSIQTLIGVSMSGLSQGLIFALLGVGITLVFGLGEILNLAHGAFAFLGLIIAIEVIQYTQSFWIAVITTIVVVGIVSLAIDRALISRIYQSYGDERIMVGIFATLGLSMVMQGLAIQAYPGQYSIPIDLPTLQILGTLIQGSVAIIIVAATAVLIVFFVFLRKTYFGKVLQTVSEDEIGAQLCGINPRSMQSIIFVIAGILAAIAGILSGLQTAVTAGGAFQWTVQALIVSIVGGARSILGTITAGIGLGLVIAYANYFIGSYLALIAMFGIAAITLIVRTGELA